jgi:hypothetical protein
MATKRKTTTLRLSEQDLKAVLAIRLHTGIASDNQAIVFAIHNTANQLQQKGEGKG